MKMIILKLKMKLIQDQVYLINSEFLNGLKAPDESIIETIKIFRKKKIRKKKN